jgi:hypothetical protein
MKALGNHASTLGKESSMRKNSRGKLSAAVRDESASLAEVQRQEEEVSSRDKPAISPETDAVPMRRRPIDSMIEEASQYLANRPRSSNFRLLSEAFGSQDPDFVYGLFMQLAHASTRFHDGEGINYMVAAIKNIHPRDANEAMAEGLIAAVSMSLANYIDELARLRGTPQQEMAERAVNRLARTFAMLVGALKKYRTGGEQKPTVRHVSVNDGGQAIVGSTVNQVPRNVLPEKTPNATPALTDARQPEMEIVSEPQRAPIPLRVGEKDDGDPSA